MKKRRRMRKCFLCTALSLFCCDCDIICDYCGWWNFKSQFSLSLKNSSDLDDFMTRTRASLQLCSVSLTRCLWHILPSWINNSPCNFDITLSRTAISIILRLIVQPRVLSAYTANCMFPPPTEIILWGFFLAYELQSLLVNGFSMLTWSQSLQTRRDVL